MIAVDWGCSNLRIFRVDANGEIIAQRRAARGILTCSGAFETILAEELVGWDDGLILLAGMIGSRQGWHEVPYVDCAATLEDIAAGMRQVHSPALQRRSVWIVPGLISHEAGRGDDVMRGEETQLLGLLQHVEPEQQIVCLPGTHSKWASVAQGQIESFLTAVTGELFDILRKHGLLAPLLDELTGSWDEWACAQGIDGARAPGGLLNHLFGVRVSGLLERMAPGQLTTYLSAMLIAHEILDSPWGARLCGRRVHLIGSSTVLHPYTSVLRHLGMIVELHDETLSAVGAYRLAKCAGLLEVAGEARY